MNTGKTRFQKGNQTAKLKAGRQHAKTIIKEKLGLNNLQEFEGDLLQGWHEMLHSKNINNKRFALKEISRYVFAVKKEVTHNSGSIEDYLEKIEAGETIIFSKTTSS